MTRRSRRRRLGGAARRPLAAVALALLAVVLLLLEPFPKGVVLLHLTHGHGVDAGDLPAVGLCLAAAWLLVPTRRRPAGRPDDWTRRPRARR